MARMRKKPVPGGEGVEVTDIPVQVVDRAAAIDVAKGSGMVCTRLPSDTRAGRRTQRVQEVTATFAAVVTLMDHLVNQGIERLVLESTGDYWRIWLRREAPWGLFIHRIFGFLRSETLAVGTTESFPQFHRQR
jgi:hypothetical protein